MDAETLLQSSIVMNLGWTLVHAIWQISLIAACLWVFLRSVERAMPGIRYTASVLALTLAIVVPAITFVQFASVKGSSGINVSNPTNSSSERSIEQRNDGWRFTKPSPGDPESGKGDQTAPSASSIVDILSAKVPSAFPILVGIWFVGVLIFLARFVAGYWQLRQFRLRLTHSAPPGWDERLQALCDRLKIGRRVRLVCSGLVGTPIAIGLLRPLIIVPASVFLQITPRELETILVHELIHIRRFDGVVNILQNIAESVLFYHPCVWWISSQVRREREFLTDADVLSFFENSSVVYAKALAKLEASRSFPTQTIPRTANAANGGQLMQRIERILKIKTEVNRTSSAWTACLVLIFTSALLTGIFSAYPPTPVNSHGRPASKQIAIGFVSIPPIDRTKNAPKDADATARLLIHKLKEYKVPATGFLQGGMVSDGENLLPARASIASMWIDAGFEVGLGGFRHISLYHTPVAEYIANLEKNERVAKRLIGDMGLPPRYFSYPYLNTGRSAADRAKVESWLSSKGYTSVKYTFDNQEWMYSWAYDMARTDNDINTMKEIREAYLSYMEKMLSHYEAYSKDLFGREIPQTMVLTPSRLITDTADEFFGGLKSRGYSFISVDQAQSDKVYQTSETYYGDAGVSWFDRWSMAAERRLRSEPEVDVSVQRAWEKHGSTEKKK